MKRWTAFFVKGPPAASNSPDVPDTGRYDLEWIVIGKKVGLSLMELNELRVRDLLEYVDIYTGNREERPRMAAQGDIDRFFA